MFVKALGPSGTGDDFVIEAATKGYESQANQVMLEMEKIFVEEGLDLNELYENEEWSDIIYPLLEISVSESDTKKIRLEKLLSECASIEAKLAGSFGRMPRTLRAFSDWGSGGQALLSGFCPVPAGHTLLFAVGA